MKFKIPLAIALSVALVYPVNAFDGKENFSTKIIETNFQNLEIREYNFSEIGKPLVIAASQSRIFVAARDSNEFRVLKIDGGSLLEVEKVILPVLTIENELSKKYILDLKYFKNKLFVSYLYFNSNINICDRLRVIEFSINDENVQFSKALFSFFSSKI